MNRDTESVNQAVRDHQLDEAKGWLQHHRLARLHEFFLIFSRELFNAQPLPLALISVEPSRRSRLGQYVPGRNGLGICHQINLNSRRLSLPEDEDAAVPKMTFLEELVVLAHEMIHEWQEVDGSPPRTRWYHNKEWLERAAGIGIIASRLRGRTIKVTDPFLSICRNHGVTDPVPVFDARVTAPHTRPKRTRWCCMCEPRVDVWSVSGEVRMVCKDCGAELRRA